MGYTTRWNKYSQREKETKKGDQGKKGIDELVTHSSRLSFSRFLSLSVQPLVLFTATASCTVKHHKPKAERKNNNNYRELPTTCVVDIYGYC